MKNLTCTILIASSLVANAQTPFNTSRQIDVNNLNARVLVHGDMWWDPALADPGVEFPKGSGKHLAFGGALWMSGHDNAAQLYVSSQTLRTGFDYWPGPLDANSTLSYTTSANWARIWKIDRAKIEDFLTTPSHSIPGTPVEILEWPAKNNPYAKGADGVPLTIPGDMAPFVDVDKNGSYDPLMGDYPDMKGDEMLWWVFSDNGPTHNNSGPASLPLKVEVRACAYGYKRNTLMDNVIYYEYYVTNKSQTDYNDFRAGLWADLDLGYHLDDYIGFDSTRRLGYVYNAASTDGTGAPGHYGDTIPMAGIVLVKSPNDKPGTLAPAGSFARHITLGSTSPIGNDTFLRASPRYPWWSGDPSDKTAWSECSISNAPGDRKFVLSDSDYVFTKGSTAVYAFALVATPPVINNGCPTTTLTSIKEVADTALANFAFPVKVTEVVTQTNSLLYPNPATNTLFIDAAINAEHLMVYDATGRKHQVTVKTGGKQTQIDVAHLPPGLYNIVYQDKHVLHLDKFIKG
ncbi:T9SS type A sorting domain-containing protein [Polluticoccus soli]|uniref:T9SS type A sorting domain-containing protein n=1 Tax=Polluticoccus soli TaxID=3034150 RepID=UPI0023E1F14E|nr:T9SS type A sorting domain-containing protein [Flavipsychrobacter sp. JY13-12]